MKYGGLPLAGRRVHAVVRLTSLQMVHFVPAAHVEPQAEPGIVAEALAVELLVLAD